jgi:hypothetical protein
VSTTTRTVRIGVSGLRLGAMVQCVKMRNCGSPDSEFNGWDCEGRSSAIMYKIYPSFQSNSSLSPQLLCRIPQCFRRSLIVRHTCLLAREQRLVEALGQVSPVRICHFPHSPDNASESTILHRGSKMKRLIGNAFLSDFCGVTARKECELRIGESRPYNLQQGETRAPVKFE